MKTKTVIVPKALAGLAVLSLAATWAQADTLNIVSWAVPTQPANSRLITNPGWK